MYGRYFEMKRTMFFKTGFAALAIALAGCSAVPQKTTETKHRVVFQVSDADNGKWNMALNNAKNVQQELGADKVEIEIVAYGLGIGMLKADAVTSNRVDEATKSGIKVVACENTMKNQKLTKADMNATISYVPAGVVELMRLHSEGWAYIRP
jgi:uncharacterized protein